MKLFDLIKTGAKYLHGIIAEKDGNPSSRRILGIIFSIDFMINVHNSIAVCTKIINLIYAGKTIDAGIISAMSTNLSQIVLILSIEAGIIGALFGLTSWTSIKALQSSQN